MKRAIGILVTVTFGALGLSGCMMTSTHEGILKKTNDEHTSAMDELTKDRDNEKGMKEQCEGKLKLEIGNKNKLSAELAAKGMQINKLLNEKGALTEERKNLSEEQKRLAAQIQELARMKEAAEKRNAEFRSLLEKLRKMIDAGTLEVKIRNGLMLVQMSSDVVFPPAGTRIKAEAREAIQELAMTIGTFAGRRFQVVGHSDSNPIHTERFPSNWELSSQRAIEVVKLMIEAGVPPEMLSAAGSAEFDPLTDNETPEGRATNRRVEIIFLPKIDELPGFDKVLSK